MIHLPTTLCGDPSGCDIPGTQPIGRVGGWSQTIPSLRSRVGAAETAELSGSSGAPPRINVISRLEPLTQSTARARVLAVDDQSSFRDVLRDVLRRTDRLEYVAEAESGEAAIELVQRLEPDVVLLDVRMPGLGGIGAARWITAHHPATLVILISTAHPDDLPGEARASGADALIWKSELEPKLLDQIWLRHWSAG